MTAVAGIVLFAMCILAVMVAPAKDDLHDDPEDYK